MTEPVAADTHPVEIACRARRPDMWDLMLKQYKEQHRQQVRKEFAALEAAGFRIVGPDPTEAMTDAGLIEKTTGGSTNEIYRAMHAAAPTWGTK